MPVRALLILSITHVGSAFATDASRFAGILSSAALGTGPPVLDCPGVLFGNPEFPAGSCPWQVASADFDGNGLMDIAVGDSCGGISILFNGGSMEFQLRSVSDFIDPSSLATGDLDGNGSPDLAVSAWPGTLSILLNLGNGSFAAPFAYVTPYESFSMAISDLDVDGDKDIVLAGDILVFLNNGDGTFSQDPVDVIGIGYDVATGDLDEDLDNDLVVSTQTGVTVLLNEGGVSFAAPIDYPVETGQFEPAGSIALEDFDGDFDVDIAAVSNDLFLFLNDGNGDFTELISYPGPPGGQAATAGDVNADGQPDLAVLGFGQEGEGHVFILLNDNGSFSTAEPYRVNAFSNSLVLQDFDEDAWPDLAVACDHTVALLQNDREGNFRDDDAYPVPRSSFFMAVGDLNGDDAQDLAVAAPEAAVVLLNNGDGTLQEAIPYRTGTGLYSIAAGDLDGDGHLDLATSDTAGVSVLFNEGDGSFDMSTSYPVEENPYSIAIGDLNCDAHPDIVTTHVAWTPPPEFGSVTVLLNKGSGEFSPAVNYYGSSPEAFSLAIADVNGDAAPDIAVAAIDLWILFNLGDGVFMDPVTYDVPTAVSVSAGDLDGDGDNDLSLGVDGDPNNGVLVLLNEGAATFSTGGTYPILGSPVSLACADIDGDHDLDLAVTNYEYHNVAILLNDGQAGFEGWISYGTGSSPSSVAVSDLNGDGSPDLAVANAPIFSGETEISILLSLCTGPPCSTLADCADLDRDGVRDDPCTWWECSAGSCMGTPTLPGDLGGSFGACAPDEATDGNDHFHALNCFANQTTMGGPGYPCEDQPPQAFNVDAGGPFGNCAPDGVCDAHDAFHAINAFAGTSTCACPTSAPSLPPSQRLRPRQP